jgi:Ca2+-binding RTX toxin-like protein
MNYTGTAGNDTFIGTTADDVFDMTQGGLDSVAGGAGDDVFNFGAVFTASDVVDGGSGVDTLKLSGDYSGTNQLVFNDLTIDNLDKIVLGTGHSYTLQMDDGNLGAGTSLSINAATLGVNDALHFQGGAESSAAFIVTGGAGADIIDGGGGNDHLVGGAGSDSLNGGQAGTDILDGGAGNDFIGISGGTATVLGGDGNDLVNVNNTFTAADRIDGGAGNDSVTLLHGVTAVFKATTITNVEAINLVAGNSYSLVTNDANVAAGQQLNISGSQLGSGDTLVFNGSHETDGSFSIVSGAGNDVLTGGAGGDNFDPGAGTDTVNGGAGNDLILMGGTFDATDRLDGGAGASDQVQLGGDYSAGVVFGTHTMTNFEYLTLDSGHSYKLTTSDATVGTGGLLNIDASQVGAGNFFNFNGTHETDGVFSITGGSGDNTIETGMGDDTILLDNGNLASPSGVDIVKTGAGDDNITIGNAFNTGDKIDGGAGNDILVYGASSDTAVHFGTATMVNVETLDIKNVQNASLISNDATVAAGQTLTVDGSTVSGANAGVTNHFSFNGAAETDGKFVMLGGDGNDALTGGAGNDSFTGGGGADMLTGNGGSDTFVYTAVNQSDGFLHDTVSGYDALADKFDLAVTVTGIDSAVTSGALSAASFDTDMAAALGAAHLAAGHAVVFTPTSGDLAGHTYLVVDAHGAAGYAANQDYVIELASSVHLANLATGDFI